MRITKEEGTTNLMKELQLTQNRLLRLLNNTRIKDKISVATMLTKFQLPSVNQLAATIKLQEVWKSQNIEGSPITMDPYNEPAAERGLRQRPNRVFNDSARLKISESSFNIDAARLWNHCPQDIRDATTLAEAKRLIKNFTKKLPI